MTTYCDNTYDNYLNGTYDWDQTCAHDSAWFQKNSKTNPRSHHRKVGAAEWWFKNQISIIWDPITKTYIYHNKHTGLTFDDPDEALFEEDLPVLEIDEARVDTRLSQYPHITAIYNVATDSYWYHNTVNGTKHFTLNRALENSWSFPDDHAFSPPTSSHGYGGMHDPEYDETPYFDFGLPQPDYHDTSTDPVLNGNLWCGTHIRFDQQEVGEREGEEETEWLRNFNKAKNEIACTKYGVDGWHQVKDNEVLTYMNQQTATPPSCHHEEDVEQRAEKMANEVENFLMQGLSDGDDKKQTPHTHLSHTTDYDPVFEQYYGREAQKRDWANLDYQEFLNG